MCPPPGASGHASDLRRGANMTKTTEILEFGVARRSGTEPNNQIGMVPGNVGSLRPGISVASADNDEAILQRALQEQAARDFSHQRLVCPPAPNARGSGVPAKARQPSHGGDEEDAPATAGPRCPVGTVAIAPAQGGRGTTGTGSVSMIQRTCASRSARLIMQATCPGQRSQHDQNN